MPQSLSSPALARVAERFAARLPDRLDALDAAADGLERDPDGAARAELERMLHDMAGTAPVLGYAALGTLARDGEDMVAALRGGSGATSEATLRDLRNQLRLLRREAQTRGAA